MKKIIYFAKLNLISDDLFDLYREPEQRNEIAKALLETLNGNRKWERESHFIDDDGNDRISIIEYSSHIIRKEDNFIEGDFYKKSNLSYKTLDEKTNKLKENSIGNTEAIRFVLDLNHGLIGYDTSRRFGYCDFIDSFVEYVNIGEKKNNKTYEYSISLCHDGLNLDDIRKELNEINGIKQLKIHIQAPNPSDDLLDDLNKRADNMATEMEDANVTSVEFEFNTSGKNGIKWDAEFVNNKLKDTQGIHNKLSLEKSTQNGYVSIDAISLSGKKYSSKQSKPIKYIVNDIIDMWDTCIDAFKKLG